MSEHPTTPIGQRELQTLADSLRMMGEICARIAKAMGEDMIRVENFMSVVKALEEIKQFINALPIQEEPPVAIDPAVERLAQEALRLAEELSRKWNVPH